MVSLAMAMLILFVVFLFVHINRLLNAGFLVQKNFSNTVYQKCVVSKQKSNLS